MGTASYLSSCRLSSKSRQVPGVGRCSGALGQLGERSREPVGTPGHQGRVEGTPRACLAASGVRTWAEEETNQEQTPSRSSRRPVLRGEIHFVKGQLVFIHSI